MTTPSGSTPTPATGEGAGTAGMPSTATSAPAKGSGTAASGSTQTLPARGGAGAASATSSSTTATAPASPTAAPATPAAGGATGPTSGASGASGATGAVRRPTAPSRSSTTTTRRVRLSVARVDPWSVMKVSFLLSFAAGVAMVVATILLWMVLSGLNVFGDIDRVIRDIQPTSAEPFSVLNYIGLPRVTALAMVIAVIDVVLMTAVATLAAYLYNICSALVGGVQLTLTDD